MTTRKASVNLEEEPSKRRRFVDGDTSPSDTNGAVAPNEKAASFHSSAQAKRQVHGMSTETLVEGVPREQGEENRRKRQRVGGSDMTASSATDTACFDSLNNDCLVHILSYLQVDDMNSIAICSKQCREARSKESLEQTRTGTIVCTQNTSVQSIYEAIVVGEWNNVFSGNCTHLIIENIDMVPNVETDAPQEAYQLPGVLSVKFSSTNNPASNRAPVSREAGELSVRGILSILPNILDIDLSCLNVQGGGLNLHLVDLCPALRRLLWKNSESSLDICGFGLEGARQLTELYLDHSCLISLALPGDLVRGVYGYTGVFFPDSWLLHHCCNNLERLSMIGATWYTYSDPRQTHPFTQLMLMKMVRNLPRLQWLRSDLTAENVVTLQAERPDVTFVSE